MRVQDKNRKGAKVSSATTLRISEIYASVQGEGLLTGTPSVFLRVSGCNLRCWFCDTPFASWEPEGDFLSLDRIVEQCHGFSEEHLVLTGGEPMIYRNMPRLCDLLKQPHNGSQGKRHITIETAGTIFQPVQCDLMSISPKLSGSGPKGLSDRWRQTHDRRRDRIEVVQRMIDEYPYQLKFVVDHVAECEEVLRYLERLTGLDRSRVMLMPQGVDQVLLEKQAEWLQPWCERQQLQFCRRAHIEWYGNRRGT